MTKRIIKNLVAIVVVLFLAWNSVYFKKLNEVKAAVKKDFDAEAYARTYLDGKLIPVSLKAPDIDTLTNAIKTDHAKAFKSYAHAMAIGNLSFFMVRGTGVVQATDENDVYLMTPKGDYVKIAVEFVFGNALRDAPGIINVNDFTNTMDLNNISSEVNKIIRTEVVPPFKSVVKIGDKVSFAGAFELNQEHMALNNIEVMPVTLKIIK